jgi:putative transposase
MEKEEDHITLLLPEAIEELQKVLMWELSLLNQSRKEKMHTSNELPQKCMECVKSSVTLFHRKCYFCRDLEFDESVLCELNRCIQSKSDFECFACQPMLKLVGPSKNKGFVSDDSSAREIKEKFFLEQLNSDKIKYERALALQRMGRDPDGIYVQLKYHFAWNVSLRRSVFSPANTFFDFVSDTFLRCSEQVGGFVDLLYLAPDHIHLYVESDGELSIEEIVYRIKQFSKDVILEKYPLITDTLGSSTEIWDEAYFVETIG